MKVIILRGLPGAGKSTWVRDNAPNAVVCSADDFLVTNGQYVWTPDRLLWAHQQCKDKFTQALYARADTVVVDNTNLKAKDFEFYVQAAEKMGYPIEIRTIHVDPIVAAQRQTHGVPLTKYPSLMARLKNPLPPELAKYEVA